MLLARVALRFILAAAVVGVVGILAPEPHADVAEAASRPNVIVVLADDLDQEVFQRSSLDAAWVGRGMRFTNGLGTTSLCCPSRASILRGQYSHNTRLLFNNNGQPGGGALHFRNAGLDRATIATLMRGGGYTTWFGGKYLNGYAEAGGIKGYVPPGWSSWQAYLSHASANVNGKPVSVTQHYTDWLSQRAVQFIAGQRNSKRPFFMQISTFDTKSEPPNLIPGRHSTAYANAALPTPPSFNEADVSDKPEWVRNLPRVSDAKKLEYTKKHRMRMRSALTLEDLSRNVMAALSRTGQLDNTYLIFTSDNGYHKGIHRLDVEKWTPYTEAHEVPFVVRGPGVPRGASTDRLVANIDIAPTALDLANIPTPRWMDGRSFVPLLDGTPPTWWRTGVLIEGAAFGLRPSYAGVRWLNKVYVRYNTGEQEYYSLANDPYQLRNNPAATPQAMKDQLQRLRACSGDRCRSADRP